MRVQVSHPFGNPNSYEVARALQERGMLSHFMTCLYDVRGLRKWDGVERKYVIQQPTREVFRLGLCHTPGFSRFGRSTQLRDWVAGSFDAWVSQHLNTDADVVYAYEDFAEYTFREAGRRGMVRVYDLPTVHYAEAREIARVETEKEPGLRPFWQSAEEPEKRLRRKRSEIENTDVIICASRFVARGIKRQEGENKRTIVIPYGAALATVQVEPKFQPEGPLRIFFAGAIGPHKGMHVLFEALSGMPKREWILTLAGRWVNGFEEWARRRFGVPYRYLGQLTRPQLAEEYQNHDVFVFPAMQDGFGLVLLEAMAAGLPVLASRNCGAPDFVEQGRHGLLHQAGDPAALRSSIGVVMGDRSLLGLMKSAARARAVEMEWSRYRTMVTAELTSVMAAMRGRSPDALEQTTHR